VTETVKCACECGAKYRLPIEFQGRTARCKKCGEKFKVPKIKNLEDSVLDWLADEPAKSKDDVEQPRVINMSSTVPRSGQQPRGPIRLKSDGAAS